MRLFSLFFLVVAFAFPAFAQEGAEVVKVEVIESHARSTGIHRLPESVMIAGDHGEAGVFVVDEKSTVLFMPVQASMKRKGWVEVKGLPEVARVLTQNENTPLPGTVVDPKVGKAILPMQMKVNIPAHNQ